MKATQNIQIFERSNHNWYVHYISIQLRRLKVKNSVRESHHGQHRKKHQGFHQPLEDTITTKIHGFHKNQKY